MLFKKSNFKAIFSKSISAIGLGFTCLALQQSVFAKVPSQDQILSWVSNHKDGTSLKNATVFDTQAFNLIGGEEAYISSVEFPEAGRNFTRGFILTRPKLSQSQILSFGGQSNLYKKHHIYYKDKSYDLIEFESAGSGQGTMASDVTLTYFKGWQATKIVEAESYSDPGRYNDKLGQEDCKTGTQLTGFLNVLPDQPYVLKTSVRGDGCASKPQDFKITSKLVPIVIR